MICEFREDYDPETLVPLGEACGAEASHVFLWLDGTQRWSPACPKHLELDERYAPPRIVVPISELPTATGDG